MVVDADPEELEERRRLLDEKMAALSLGGMWQPRERMPVLEPFIWHWKDIWSCLEEAGEIVAIDEKSPMRTMQLAHPLLAKQRATSRTLQVSVQLLKPGERALAHRHTPPQPRFIVDADGAQTTIEGEQMAMETGDLIVTPGWAWHNHANFSAQQAVWLDIHDPHLVNYLGANFNERFGEGGVQPVTKPEGYHRDRLRSLRPKTFDGFRGALPLKYPWRETLEALEAMNAAGESDPHDGVHVRYTNPLDGGPAMPTIGCQVQMLRPGETTRPHRHTDTTVCHVVSGSGMTTFGKGDEQELPWEERDCFIVPPWTWHRHENASSREQAVIFSVTDRPAIEALGYHREEQGHGP